MLQVKGLKKHFGGVKAVDGCSFELEEKKITALIGPNGSGKTTVFNLVSGVLKADAGRIIFDGTEITGKSPDFIANLHGFGISRMFQQSRLFGNLAVRENLLLGFDNNDTKFWKNLAGKNKVSKEKELAIKKMLGAVGLPGFENRLARDLSYGQKRLAELARTVLNPHKLLMLDEPVAGVNPKLRKEIASILLGLKKKGETILLIEHDMDFTLGTADKVIVMDEGKVIAQGTPKEIKNNKRVLEAYLGE